MSGAAATLSRLVAWHRRIAGLLLLALAALTLGPQAMAQDAETGRTLYASKGCNGCHNTPPTLSGNINRGGANAPQVILDAIAFNIAQMAGLSVSASEATSLALFLGQKEAPSFSVLNGDDTLKMRLRAGQSFNKNVYPLLDQGFAGAASDGTITAPVAFPTVGLTVTQPPNTGSSTATIIGGSLSAMNYRVRYVSGSTTFAGTDDFTVSVANQSATTATRTIAVTVYGVTSPATATIRQQDTGPAVTLYTMTSNDPLATFSATVDGASLASVGLSVGSRTCNAGGCSQPIVGTFTGIPKAYTLAVTAAISGTTAVESGGGNVTKNVTLNIQGITSGATATFTQNQAISNLYQITSSPSATTGNYTVVSLDPNLVLGVNQTTGQITGTPGVAGTFNITVGATTGAPAAVVTKNVTVTVNSAGPPSISSNIPTSPTVAGTVGSPINGSSWTISLTNPSQTLSYGATGLPGGLSVSAGGQFIGTPSAGQSGDFPISIQGSNAGGLGGAGAGTPLLRTIRINPNQAPVISGPASVSLNANQLANPGYTIAATNPPITGYSVVAGTLPTGLTLNANGTVTGTPTVSGGPTNVTFRATNIVNNSNDLVVAFTIVPSIQPVVTAPFVAAPTLTGTVGTTISPTIQIAATNPPITAYGATGLPGGLTVDANGLISGVPSQSGDFSVVATANNAAGQGSSAPAVTIRIAPNALPVINSAGSVSGPINAPFNYAITATNPVHSAFALAPGATLPAGLNLVVTPGAIAGATTAAITGTPTVSGVFNTSLTATNAFGTSAAFPLTITILPTTVPVVTATIPTPAGTVGGGAITPIQINATNLPITGYSATGLPAGLSVNGSGQIVGTPTLSGIFSVTLTATNNAGLGSSAPLNLQINPNAVPAINSAATVNGQAGTPITNYQITATNNPLTAFAVKPPSVLPAGLTLNTGTGVISGTPTISGNSSAVITATNIVGTSADFTLNFAIVPSTAPAISSPTFATLPAGALITPIQIVATNLPILSYSATGLPPGLGLDTNTGLITGTPTTPGSFSATLNATNVVSAGAGRVVPFTITVPAPTACAISTPFNTPATVNLTSCFFGGFNPTGVTILSTPAHGTVSASGPSVTYTPKNNYFGPDSFTMVGTGTGGTSPVGTVTVTVTGLPNPTQDKAVSATISAQTEAAQRFSRAQLANVQRRLDALHRPPGASFSAAPAADATAAAGQSGASGSAQPAGPLPGEVTQAAALSQNQASSGARPSFVPRVGFAAPMALALNAGSSNAAAAGANALAEAARVLAPAGTANAAAAMAVPRTIGQEILQGSAGWNGPGITPNGARQVRESEALGIIANGLGVQSMPLAESAMSLIKGRSLNLANIGQAAGLNTRPDSNASTNYWIEGVLTFGTRDASGGLAGSEFATDGITIGVDRRINDEFAWGVGLGYARDKTTIGTDGSLNRSKGYSLSVYGSYQIRPNTYLDGLVGIGSLDFSTRRFVEPAGLFAYGNRTGTQLFGSLTGSYEFRDGNSVLAPYGRLDIATERLNTASETGAGAFSLTYFGQTSTSIQGSLGVRSETAHAASFGYVIPRLRAELRHEFKGTGDAFVGYASLPGGPRFGISTVGGSRDSVVLGLGSDFLMRDGLTVSVEYQLNHSFSNASSYALRLRLSKDFDVRGMPKLKLAEPEGDDDELKWQGDAGYTRDDNVTRAKSGPDRLFDDLYSFNLVHSDQKRLSDNTRIVYGFSFGGQKFHRFNGLSNIQAGGELEYQYRASSEFLEPTYGAFAKINAEEFESRLRDGYRLAAGLSLRLPITDRIGAFAAFSHNVRNARSQVFSTRDNSIRGNVDYALSDRETLYLGSELRVGDIVSTGRASLENVTIAKVFAQDDAYAAGNLFSYRVDGRTWLTTIGYNLTFGPRDSIDFSWRNVRATPGLRPSFVTGPRSYRANQLSAVYLLRF